MAFALVLTLVFAACAPAPTQPSVEGEAELLCRRAIPRRKPSRTAIVAQAGTRALELIYWNGLTGSDGATMVEMVEAFTAENPEVSVRVEMMPWNIYFDKLLTSLVSGNPPRCSYSMSLRSIRQPGRTARDRRLLPGDGRTHPGDRHCRLFAKRSPTRAIAMACRWISTVGVCGTTRISSRLPGWT